MKLQFENLKKNQHVSLFIKSVSNTQEQGAHKVSTDHVNRASGAFAQALHILPFTYSAAGCCCLLGMTGQTLVQGRRAELDQSELQGQWNC